MDTVKPLTSAADTPRTGDETVADIAQNVLHKKRKRGEQPVDGLALPLWQLHLLQDLAVNQPGKADGKAGKPTRLLAADKNQLTPAGSLTLHQKTDNTLHHLKQQQVLRENSIQVISHGHTASALSTTPSSTTPSSATPSSATPAQHSAIKNAEEKPSPLTAQATVLAYTSTPLQTSAPLQTTVPSHTTVSSQTATQAHNPAHEAVSTTNTANATTPDELHKKHQAIPQGMDIAITSQNATAVTLEKTDATPRPPHIPQNLPSATPSADSNATTFTYQFRQWGTAHSVQIQPQHDATLLLQPSSNLVEQRLHANWQSGNPQNWQLAQRQHDEQQQQQQRQQQAQEDDE